MIISGLKQTSSVKVSLTEEDEEEDPEKSDEDESADADFDKLLAESEACAKPRIPRPPIEKPMAQAGGESSCTLEAGSFMDPLRERTFAADDLGALSIPLTQSLPAASLVTRSLNDFDQRTDMLYGFAPVPL